VVGSNNNGGQIFFDWTCFTVGIANGYISVCNIMNDSLHCFFCWVVYVISVVELDLKAMFQVGFLRC